jgi:hypothetical protein
MKFSDPSSEWLDILSTFLSNVCRVSAIVNSECENLDSAFRRSILACSPLISFYASWELISALFDSFRSLSSEISQYVRGDVHCSSMTLYSILGRSDK